MNRENGHSNLRYILWTIVYTKILFNNTIDVVKNHREFVQKKMSDNIGVNLEVNF